jgi:hypothetical protein
MVAWGAVFCLLALLKPLPESVFLDCLLRLPRCFLLVGRVSSILVYCKQTTEFDCVLQADNRIRLNHVCELPSTSFKVCPVTRAYCTTRVPIILLQRETKEKARQPETKCKAEYQL